MIHIFIRWHRNYKIALFIGICLLLTIGNILIFIAHPFAEIQALKKQQHSLDSQVQERHLTEEHRQQLLKKMGLLQNHYQARLRELHRLLTPAALYRQITLLAKAQHLQILAIKPQKSPSVAGLQQQILNIDMNGPESAVLNFLQLLMHQFWLLEIQKIELSTSKNGIHLHASLAAYYATI